jgi:hypothetical protein
VRAIHLRAFSFFLAFFEPNKRGALLDDFSKAFLDHMKHSAAAGLQKNSAPHFQNV